MKDISENRKWSEEDLANEALKYQTPKDFSKNSKSAYSLALKKGKDFYDKITSHFDRSSYNFWDEKSVEDEALKYNTIRDFREKSNNAYARASSMGKDFFEKITSHMFRERKKQDRKFYTDDELKQEALKFKTKKEFANNNNAAYQQSMKRGKEFYDNITSHMEYLGNLTQRMIYAFLFENKVIYIGLTYDIGVREKQHLQLDDKHKRSKSSVRDYIKLTGETPKMIKLTDYLPYKEAQKKEEEFVQKFSNEGYTILNKVKAGNLGAGTVKWTENKLRNEALKYETVKDFRENSYSAFTIAQKKGKDFFNDITKHMIKKLKYTKPVIYLITQKYNEISEFRKNEPNAYYWAYNLDKDFFNEVTSHMTRKR